MIFTRDRGRLWIDDHRGLLKTWSRATTSWPLYKRALLFNSSTPYKIRKLLTYKFLSALKKWKIRESVDSNNSIIFPSKFRHLFSSTYQFFLRFQLSFLKLRRVTEFSHRLIFIVTEENNVLFFSFVHLFEWKHCRRFSRRKLYAWYHECCVYPEYTVIRSEKRSKRYFAFNRQKCWDRFIITTIPRPLKDILSICKLKFLHLIFRAMRGAVGSLVGRLRWDINLRIKGSLAKIVEGRS